MGALYPVAVNEIERWRVTQGVTVDEARKRFIQFVVLESIAGYHPLGEALAFKGGNALRFIHGNPRATADLDFTAVGQLPDEELKIRSVLDAALHSGGSKHGIKLRCQRVRRNPANKTATFPTYDVAVGYQFPGDRYFADYDKTSRTVASVVAVEISFNDVVCEIERRVLAAGQAVGLQVCSLEDILAEKLRALLQQVPRNRSRPQDVFDLARNVTAYGHRLDYAKIATYLVSKSGARGIVATKAAFQNPEVKQRASVDYESSLQLTQSDLTPFDDAWATVLALVSRLDIPG
jgi:predicted nucleotidyltransferase component of viral defense system